MLKILPILGCLVMMTFVKNGFSQTGNDTILLLNGKSVIGTVIDTTGGVTTLKNPKPNKKDIIIENDRIFSISNPTGETIYYVYDTLIGNEFTVDEMRYFIKGEQDAEGYKTPWAFWGNMAIGAAGGVTGSVLAVLPPFIFSAASGLPKVKVRSNTVSKIDYLKQDTYVMGYAREVRKERKINSLKGGGIGLILGFGTYFILKSTDNEIDY